MEGMTFSTVRDWCIRNDAPYGVVITKEEAISHAAIRRGMRVQGGPGGTEADFALSAHWPTILRAADLSEYETVWNLHPGLLPWGRGYGPAFWALWAGEPAGATLHEMTAELDGGPIVDQVGVHVRPQDTGESLYRRILEVRRSLFRKWWPRLVAGERPIATPQPEGGSYHSRADLLALRDAPDLEAMTASDLVRLTRALTMTGMPGPRVDDLHRLTWEMT